jgi:dethiobiotin synthetase
MKCYTEWPVKKDSKRVVRLMMKAGGFFITGTDTGVGKTWVTVALMQALKNRGLTTLGMKPVASGCRWENGVLVNDDALLLQANASFPLPYDAVNPFAFEPAVSPHIAAEQAGIRICLTTLQDRCRALQRRVDCVLVEGIGGWEVPLNREQRVSDLAAVLDLPVIVVVGLRLGCLNHALLTLNALERSGVPCAGWVANQIDPGFACLSENIETLRQVLQPPLLGVVPYMRGFEPNRCAHYLSNVDAIL